VTPAPELAGPPPAKAEALLAALDRSAAAAELRVAEAAKAVDRWQGTTKWRPPPRQSARRLAAVPRPAARLPATPRTLTLPRPGTDVSAELAAFLDRWMGWQEQVDEELEALRRSIRALDIRESRGPAAAEPPGPPAPAATRPHRALLAGRERVGRSGSPWLGHALGHLALEHPDVAAGMVAALLRVPRGEGGLVYVVTIEGWGALTVDTTAGTVEVLSAPATGEVDLRVRGTPAKLAATAAGGIDHWPPGVSIEGDRRASRALLRSLRRPLGLVDLLAAGVEVDSSSLLRTLAAGVEPSWVGGPPLAVAWELDGQSPVLVGFDDRGASVRPPAAGVIPAATISLSPQALLPLLAGQEPPSSARWAVHGDPVAARRALELFDRVQWA
jgi:hypothetical protein